MNARFSAAAAVLLSLLVGACTQLPPRPSAGAWAPPTWSAWELQGRIAVRAADEGWHAKLTWRQTDAAYQADVSGPLGQGALRLRGDATGVVLERGDGQREQSADADGLLEQHIGWRLPVNGLRYWMLGQAAPGREASWERGADGRPLRLQQDGWDIRYQEYQDQAGMLLPRRIEMEHARLHARLVIDTWTPLQTD